MAPNRAISGVITLRLGDALLATKSAAEPPGSRPSLQYWAVGVPPPSAVRFDATDVKYCSMRARSLAPRFCITRFRSSATADSTLFCHQDSRIGLPVALGRILKSGAEKARVRAIEVLLPMGANWTRPGWNSSAWDRR